MPASFPRVLFVAAHHIANLNKSGVLASDASCQKVLHALQLHYSGCGCLVHAFFIFL